MFMQFFPRFSNNGFASCSFLPRKSESSKHLFWSNPKKYFLPSPGIFGAEFPSKLWLELTLFWKNATYEIIFELVFLQHTKRSKTWIVKFNKSAVLVVSTVGFGILFARFSTVECISWQYYLEVFWLVFV